MSRNIEKYGGARQLEYEQPCCHSNIVAVVESLTSIFGEVMERDALFAIVESCNGDQSLAAEALLDIMSQNQPELSDQEQPQSSSNQPVSRFIQEPQNPSPPNPRPPNPSPPNPGPPNQQQTLSYCNVTRAPSTSNNQRSFPTHTDNVPTQIWSEDLKRIFYNHNKGYKTMIILRGLPGSGKSYLGKQIIEMTVGPGRDIYHKHVFSSDDFFYVNGIYVHDKQKLGDAHEWNQRRVHHSLMQGLSPIIVDNTNVQYWEMGWYARAGVKEGYFIEILEPQTKWAWSANQLFRKNIHNVPIHSIKRMYGNYDSSISGPEFLRKFNIHYSREKQPPILRLIPEIDKAELPNEVQIATNQDKVLTEQQQITNVPTLQSEIVILDVDRNDGKSSESSEGINLEKYAEVTKKLEEFDKLDREWEKGENWDDQESQSAVNKSPQRGPKPQRSQDKELLLPTVEECKDWSVLIPPWTQDIPPNTQTDTIPVETRESCTCMELGDNDHLNSKYKVVTGTPRDINFHYMPLMNQTHKDNMFDKSTMTCDLDSIKEKNEKKLFQQFRRMFKTIPRSDLRDIFDKCGGDVSWAVELVIGGVHQSVNVGDYEISDTENSDDEEEEDSTTIPGTASVQTTNENIADSNIETKESVPQLLLPKKIKKDKTVSESSLNLKRQIEKNIVMPDKFYSEHTVKLRKGTFNQPRNNPAGEGTSKDIPTNGSSSENETTDTESAKSDDENNVTFNLGRDFVKNLDRIFDRDRGDSDRNWEHIVPVVTMPMVILNQINALWLQSLAYQVESQVAYSELMMKQDEEFARQLAQEEEELNKPGQEPKVPDLKEIMNMDLAQTLYRKEIEKVAPNDWAAKMTMDKLSYCFTDIPKETLCEMLMAHENGFQATVETLLMSTGQGHVLEQENGVNKFVMEKEMQRQAKVIEEEKKKQIEQENTDWPLLTELASVDMTTVQSYRHTAFEHLEKRNQNMEKAYDYFRKKMIEPATYAFGVASYHKTRFEQANSLAATALIHVNHANNNDKNTLDLHYLFVTEALQTLDLYIDHHIQLLQEHQLQVRRDLFLITGRGLHSKGNGPKIKPAVKKRLKERELRVFELNPGLLTVKLTKECLLTHQLPKKKK